MNDRNDPLIRRAADLPRALEPQRDLWAGIARRLEPATEPAPVQHRRVWPAALAAGVMLAVMSSSVTWWFATRGPTDTERLAAVIAQPTDPYAQNAELIQVRQQLTASLDDALGRLAPKTRREVTTNLLEIHESMAEIRAALQQDPNNIFLHRLLYTTYEQELGLLSDINRLALTVPGEIEI